MAGRVMQILWQQSWQIAVLFVLVGFACRLLRGASAHWRYLLWVVVLIKCLVLPIVSITLPGMPDSAHQILSPSIPATRELFSQDLFWQPV